MKWVFVVLVGFNLLIFSGCGPKETVKEPTPNIEAEFQGKNEMEAWFTDARYTFFVTGQALDTIEEELLKVEAGENRSRLANLIDYYNESGNLNSRLRTKLGVLSNRKAVVEQNPTVGAERLKNLTDLTNILAQLVNLTSTFPENPSQFKQDYSRFKSQFLSLENLLLKEFVDSNSNLDLKKSEDNPEYRRDLLCIMQKSEPKPQPTEEPDETNVPDVVPATPTPEPVYEAPKVWRDADGNLRMGQKPPEGVEARDPSGPVSQSAAPEPEQPDQPTESEAQTEESTETRKSLIWTDENGNVHMGVEPPEGAEVRNAEDIPIMQIN